ncbi:insulinase family protein [Qiania dongpingensis]|uniref:Insulinase family protein n=2 Tax=Qiania dongpingensis TaxID=2763669 RepID=A0A7G9G4E7_9FIRM|nr:insulinase family protein [Qiania dongpingensis]
MMEQCMLTKNGIPVYSYPNQHLHSFCLCMYVKAGSMYEKKQENGIAHFYEHVVIRNINSLMNGQFYKVLDRFGLSFNGATYKEFVQFSISGAAEHWNEAAEIFVKLFEPLALSEEEVATERKRVKAEIRECEKKKSAERRMEIAVWKGTSLTQTIAGKKKNLERTGKKELSEYRRQFLSFGNLFLYATGRCSQENLEYLRELLEQSEWYDAGSKRMNLAPVPENFFHRSIEPVLIKGGETELAVSFDVDTSRYTDAMLCLFYDMLFVGDYCPMYQELSEKTGYIYSYDDRFERYKNLGSLQLNYEVSSGKLMKAFQRTMEVFRKMKHSPGSLEYVRAIYVDNGDMALDDADDFNWNRAYDCHILDEEYPDIEKKKEAFQRVTEEDMARMAREIFRPENMVVVIKGNKKKIPVEKIKGLIRTLAE